MLAKLTRPRLYDPVPRERLFALLDEARQHPVVWVVGPPGAGKTTLLASYMDARRTPASIWYQIDGGDNDTPSFFYHLQLAERALPRRGRSAPLPLMTPEYLADIPTFTRRFTRELYARMPAGSLLVLDNFQELADDNRLQEALARCIAEVPRHVNLAILSRTRPGAHFAGGVAAEAIAFVEWEALKLTVEETRAVIAARARSRSIDALRLFRQTGGWAAGVTLLIEQGQQAAGTLASTESEGIESVFDYFTSQLFDQLEEAEREALLRLSVLPHFTGSQAQELSEAAQAERMLDHLYRRNLFTTRRRTADGQEVYQFHALFRSFLRYRAVQRYTQAGLVRHIVRGAESMHAAGQTEEAAALFIEAGDWDRACALTLADAPRFIGQGRQEALIERIGAIPAERVSSEHWLLFWLGIGQLCTDPGKARPTLMQAHARARESNDAHGVLQAAAAIVQTYILEYSHLTPLDEWLPVLEPAMSELSQFPDVDSELNVISALLMVISYRQPGHSLRERCIERIYELVMVSGDANLRMIAMGFMVAHSCTTGHLNDGIRALAIGRELADRPDVTPINVGWWLAASTWYHTLAGDYAQARNAMREILRIGAQNELPVVTRFALTMGIWTEIFDGNLQLADRMVDNAPPPTNETYDVGTLAGAASLIATLDGRPESRLHQGVQSVRLFDEMGSRMHRVNFRMLLIWSQLKAGHIDAALVLIDEARAVEADRPHYWQQALLWALTAEACRLRGDEPGRKAAVVAALGAARQRDYWYGFVYPFDLPALCRYALAHDIDTEYVRHIARKLRWPAPSQAVIDWPWAVRISTLGDFRILVDDVAVEFGRKAPRRLLSVLKALIAFGGREVASERLADTIWPDAEGDSGQASLTVALRRLRDLLGGDFVGEVDGKISLDTDRVWVDAFAFEQALQEATGDARAKSRALSLYRGAFLKEETDARWSVSPRERLRAKFIEQVGLEAARLEAQGGVESAAALYRRGMEADDLAEPFYQGLMRCQIASGARADALATYRRLRSVLSVVLGIAPSPATEALHAHIRDQRP